MRVSVVVPAYNAGKYIEETLNSVLSQSFKDFEVIVVDDGSVDDTAEVVKKVVERDSRIKYFYKENQGNGSYARNTGFQKASGEFITLLDSDDLWPSDRLEKQLRLMLENPNKVIIGNVHRFCVSEQGEKSWLATTTLPQISGGREEYLQWLSEVPNELMVHFNTLMCKREYLIQYGQWDIDLVTAHDWEAWYRMAEHFEIIHTDEIYQLYRKHDGSCTRSRKLSFVLNTQLKAANKMAGKGLGNFFKRLRYRRFRYYHALEIVLFERYYAYFLREYSKAIFTSDLMLSVHGAKLLVTFLKKLLLQK